MMFKAFSRLFLSNCFHLPEEDWGFVVLSFAIFPESLTRQMTCIRSALEAGKLLR